MKEDPKRRAHPTGRGRLAAAFCVSLAVALAAFPFAADTAQRILILVLAFAPFAIAARRA